MSYPRRAFAFLVCLAGVGTCLSACADGDPISTGTSSGNGGAGGGGGGPGGSGPATTTGNNCVEQPCKLVSPQCGCEDGFACSVDGVGDRVCLAAGAVQPGQPCSDSALCAPGAVCVGYGPDLNSCSAFCADDTDCVAPGGRCVVPLAASDALLCSEDCELSTNAGCALAGTSCQFGLTGTDEVYTLCAPSGTKLAQEICLETSECSPGMACFPTSASDERCFEWCVVGGPPCPTGFTCDPLELSAGVPLAVGTTAYGACNPN